MQGIEAFYREADESSLDQSELSARLASTQIVRTRYRTVDAAGQVTDTLVFSFREPRGIFESGYYFPQSDSDAVFDPPLLVFPSGAQLGDTWASQGTFGSLTYEHSARLEEMASFDSALGPLTECLRLESEFSLQGEGGEPTRTHSTSWLCPELGTVAWEERDTEGALLARSDLASARGRPVDASLLPPPLPLSPTEEDAGDEQRDEAWAFSRVGRIRPAVESPTSTIPPVWGPGEPPLLLAAAYGGDLVAYDAEATPSREVWRFHTDGTLFSPPAWDTARGRLYVGSSDKHLYALDTNGLFLWSFPTGDNIASRPLVVGDTVVFGSEDRHIYGVDAATGALRWTIQTGGAVVSSPALAGDMVVIGSDDGAAYGIDVAACNRAPDACEPAWLFPTEDAIEAPIVADGEVAFVASRDGVLYALDGASGEEQWAASVGVALRSAPALHDGRVFVVSDYNRLYAFDQASGRRLWRTDEEQYIGPPVPLGDGLLVAGTEGRVFRVDLQGRPLESWSVEESGIADPSTDFHWGVTAGGGALWLADDNAFVWRLGPAATVGEPTALAPSWVLTSADDPLQMVGFYASLAEEGGQALTMDGAYNLYRLDPQTGDGERIGQLATAAGTPFLDPVVGDDTAWVVVGETLHAIDLNDGSERWATPGAFALRPPAAASGELFWLARSGDLGAEGPGTLLALDGATGEALWEAALGDILFPGSVHVQGELVLTSTPPAAWDRESGDLLWAAAVEGTPGGGGALSPDGDTFFVSLSDAENDRSRIVALDTTDGSVRWETLLAGDFLDPFDTLWLSDDTLIVPSATGRGTLIGLSAATGAEQWRYEPDVALFGNVTVAEGRVWFTLQDGQVLALDARSGEVALHFSGLGTSLESLDALGQRPVVLDGTVIVPIGLGFIGLELP